MNIENKWLRAAVPALLIHCSIGTVYCWSTIKDAIAAAIGMTPFATGWAFSLAIFFLGTSAAFAGSIVETDIRRSSLIACLCFCTGMLGTGLVIKYLTGMPALIGIYICYGCIMGTGLGIGYLTPVKTLMLWFSEQKGLATGISIMGFGLAKAIATPIMEVLQKNVGISGMFFVLTGVYFIMMFAGHLLLRKPSGWKEIDAKESTFKVSDILKDKTFIFTWLIFYINIHCGLMLISYEKQILMTVFAGTAIIGGAVAVIPSVTAIANALGRIGYSTISDKMKDRLTVYRIIFTSCVIIGLAVALIMMFGTGAAVMTGTVILLVIINLGYGGGFSTLPALLSQYFGMDNISKIHGMTLTAWAVAGITGNNLSEAVLQRTDRNFAYIIIIATLLYAVAFAITGMLKKTAKKSGV